MVVIINEFEAVVEPPKEDAAPRGGDAEPRSQEPDSAMLSPLDLEELLSRRLERAARTMAD